MDIYIIPKNYWRRFSLKITEWSGIMLTELVNGDYFVSKSDIDNLPDGTVVTVNEVEYDVKENNALLTVKNISEVTLKPLEFI